MVFFAILSLYSYKLYQRGNQKSYIEEQTIRWPKEEEQTIRWPKENKTKVKNTTPKSEN